MFCWVLALLLSPTVSLLAPGVSEGVFAFGSGGCGSGVGAGAGVGVAVTGPGCGFGHGWSLGVAGRGGSPLLVEGFLGLPLCPSGVSGGPSTPLAGGCWVLVLPVFVCCVRFWCGRCSRVGVWCAFVGQVSVAAVAVCVVCACGRVCGVLVVRLGACPRLSWLGLAALCGCGGCVSWPLSRPGCGVRVRFPTNPGRGLLVVACPPAPLRALPRLSLYRVAWGGDLLVPCPGPSRLWWVGGGGPCCWLGSLPLVFPLGGADACTPRQGVTLLYRPSICTRSVQMDLLRSQVLQPFPTPGSGTLWVAGESLRDRCVSCLPRWTVCPTRSPSLGPNRSTCLEECSWSGPLVNPPRPVPPRAADQRSWAYPTLLRVLTWGRYGHRGGPATPEVGSLTCVSRGPLSSCPPFAVWFVVVGFPSLLGGPGDSSPFLAELLVCVSPPPLVVVRRAWRWVVPRHSWLWVFSVAPRHSWLGSSGVGGGRAFAIPG